MIRRSTVVEVLGAVVAALKASATVVTLAVGGVWNSVPQGTARFPYVEVTSPSDIAEDTFSRFGARLIVDVMVVSQARAGDLEAANLLNACIQALDFAALSATSPITILGVTWRSSDRAQEEPVNGVTTRYHTGRFEVWAEQTA